MHNPALVPFFSQKGQSRPPCRYGDGRKMARPQTHPAAHCCRHPDYRPSAGERPWQQVRCCFHINRGGAAWLSRARCSRRVPGYCFLNRTGVCPPYGRARLQQRVPQVLQLRSPYCACKVETECEGRPMPFTARYCPLLPAAIPSRDCWVEVLPPHGGMPSRCSSPLRTLLGLAPYRSAVITL